MNQNNEDNKKGRWLAILLPILIIAGIAVLFKPSAPKVESEALKNRIVELDSNTLPVYEGQSPEDDLAFGQLAPTFTALNVDNKKTAVDFERPTLLIFLAHWCPHCNREMKALQADWVEEGVYEDIDVIAVLTGINKNQANYPPDEWLESFDWPYTPGLLDNDGNDIFSAYGGKSFPYMTMVDSNGRVLWRKSGETPPAELRLLVNDVAKQPESNSSTGEEL